MQSTVEPIIKSLNKNGEALVLLVEQAIDGAPVDRLVLALEPLHPAEIADVLESLPYEQRLFVWRLLNANTNGDALVEAHGEVRRQLIRETSAEELVTAVERLDRAYPVVSPTY